MEQERLLKLGDFYAVHVLHNVPGQYTGEVIRLSEDPNEAATHLFDVPPQPDTVALKGWAQRALSAYLEG